MPPRGETPQPVECKQPILFSILCSFCSFSHCCRHRASRSAPKSIASPSIARRSWAGCGAAPGGDSSPERGLDAKAEPTARPTAPAANPKLTPPPTRAAAEPDPDRYGRGSAASATAPPAPTLGSPAGPTPGATSWPLKYAWTDPSTAEASASLANRPHNAAMSKKKKTASNCLATMGRPRQLKAAAGGV